MFVKTINDKSEEMLFYDEKDPGYYKFNAEGRIKEFIEKRIKKCTTGIVNNVLDAVRRENFVSRDDFGESMKPHILENCLILDKANRNIIPI